MRFCNSCNEVIPDKRVKVFPRVSLCVECQEELENSNGFQRHRMDIVPEIESWENVGVEQVLVRGTEV